MDWGGEDLERVYRFRALGLKVKRVSGLVIHLDHPTRPSTWYSPECRDELLRVTAMQSDDLWAYVKTWPWRTNGEG